MHDPRWFQGLTMWEFGLVPHKRAYFYVIVKVLIGFHKKGPQKILCSIQISFKCLSAPGPHSSLPNILTQLLTEFHPYLSMTFDQIIAGELPRDVRHHLWPKWGPAQFYVDLGGLCFNFDNWEYKVRCISTQALHWVNLEKTFLHSFPVSLVEEHDAFLPCEHLLPESHEH